LNQNCDARENEGPATRRIYKQIGIRELRNGLRIRIVISGTLVGVRAIVVRMFADAHGPAADPHTRVSFLLLFLL
jgi:hypothetical protein